MEAQKSDIRDGNDHAVLHEVSIQELQDAVSQNLAFFYKRAYRYLGDPHDAEDAVQDALLSAYKHLDQFKRTAKMTTWLTSIVTNSALSQLRRRPRHPHICDKRTTSAPIGARNVEQLDNSLDALKQLQFTDEELSEIDLYAREGSIDLWRGAREGVA